MIFIKNRDEIHLPGANLAAMFVTSPSIRIITLIILAVTIFRIIMEKNGEK